MKKTACLTAALLLVLTLVGCEIESGDAQKVGEVTKAETSSINTEAEPETFSIGDQVKLNDTIITFNGISTNTGSEFVKPEDGNVFILCDFTIENQSSDDLGISSLLSFECYCDDFTCSYSLSAIMAGENVTQIDGSIAPGKKSKGVIGYEIPVDWKKFEIHFKPNVFSSNDVVFLATNE